MKIDRIQNFNITPKLNTYKYTSRQLTNEQKPEMSNTQFPTTAQYLAFTGGYSLNLAETVKQLDKFAEKNSSIYPKNIREWIGMVLEEGNQAKEALISIHKKYFSNLKECFNLDEIKQKFPEFKDAVSVGNVKVSENSFIDKFNKGELEYFDNEEDLTVQLIKLYWGEGFSLSDLRKYAAGHDLHYTMKKLNIPFVSRDYGHILKLSDPEYNARLTREMTEKRLAALDRKAQIESGEPVYIPRGPMSAQQKQRISEGLKKFWQENPERIFIMSERMKEFYRQNPDKSEELSRVLNKAWGLKSADGIKAALSKFLKYRKIPKFDFESSPEKFSKEQSNAMKAFWGLNDWAKKSFSKNMQYAWKKIKEENETFLTLRTTPTKMKRFIEQKAGMDQDTLNCDTVFNPYTMKSSIDKNADAICRKYSDIKGMSNVMADTYQIAVLNIVGALKDMKPDKSIKKAYDNLLAVAAYTAHNNINKGGQAYKIQTTQEAQQDYITLAAYAATTRCQKLIDIVNKALDDSFDMALQFHEDFILK